MADLLPLSLFEDSVNNPTKIRNIIKQMIKKDVRFRRAFTNINGLVEFGIRVEAGKDINAYAHTEDGIEYLTFTEGCMENLTDSQFMGVVGHEMAHHLKGDYNYAGFTAVLTFSILMSISTLLGYLLSSIISHYIGFTVFGIQLGSIMGSLVFIAGFFTTFYFTAKIYWLYFQKSEFRADRICAEVLGPDCIIDCLKSLESPNRQITRLDEFLSQFATHPSISDRIEAIEKIKKDLQEAS